MIFHDLKCELNLSITALVESLIGKTTEWEDDNGMPFMYDGVR